MAQTFPQTTTHLAQSQFRDLVLGINKSERGYVTARLKAPARGRYADGQYGANFTPELLTALADAIDADAKGLSDKLRAAIAYMVGTPKAPTEAKPITTPSLPSF